MAGEMHSDRDENEGASKDSRAVCRRVEGKLGYTGEGVHTDSFSSMSIHSQRKTSSHTWW